MDSHGSSLRVLIAALAGNLAIAVCKFVAAWLTGSAAMFSEAIHSTVDTGNEILLMWGLRRARRAPDASHPFGYGLQLYFYVFVVAVLIFGFGAVFSLIEGIEKLNHPAPVEKPFVNYIVLSLSIVFETFSWIVAYREFSQQRGEMGLFHAVRRSKDPTVFAVLFEDTAALIGLVIALTGLVLADVLHMPVLDGVASIGIALVLAATAFFLGFESQSLLTGEGVLPELRQEIERIAAGTPGVVAINQVLTMHFGPNDVLVALSLDFDDTISAAAVEGAVTTIDRSIKAAIPEVSRVFVEAQSFDEDREERVDEA